MSLSVQGNQLTEIVTSDQTWTFKWKLEFWETIMYHPKA